MGWAAQRRRAQNGAFLALHLSGGTSEVLEVAVTGDYRLRINCLGEAPISTPGS